jgi:hypothetical protein
VKDRVLFELTTTAPDAGDDLLAGETDVVSDSRNRVLIAVACTGGTAAGDSVVEIKAGKALLARVTNSATGNGLPGTAYRNCGGSAVIPGKVELSAELVTDGGNDIALGLVIA